MNIKELEKRIKLVDSGVFGTTYPVLVGSWNLDELQAVKELLISHNITLLMDEVNNRIEEIKFSMEF